MAAKPATRRAGAGRGPKGSITSLEGCDMKDPFAAFQGLRSLLEGIGGSKRGMSPSEHKLTLRLLDIVEPFIGATPYKKELINQPNEVLDEIAFHIDSKLDLLAFALTCERMYRVIFPRHFEYRMVRARLTSTSVWQHLLDNRALARGVRQLEVLDARSNEPEIVPSRIETVVNELDPLNIHAQQEALVLKVIAALPTLTDFTWSSSRSLVNIEKLWDTLILCGTLTTVEILDSSIFNANIGASRNCTSNGVIPKSTRSLKSMTVRNSNIEPIKNPSLDRVSNMLIDRCPNLESLSVICNAKQGLPRARADSFISQARWSCLKVLTLRAFWCSGYPGNETLALFLFEHRNIEILCLNIGRLSSDSLHLLPDTLPRLKEMTVNKELARAIMMAPVTNNNNKRPIEVIKGVGLSGLPHDQSFFNALKMYDIKRMELDRFNDIDDIRHLVECVPNLVWLDVGLKCNYRTGPLTIPNASDWAVMLSPLQELVAFHGLRLFYDSLTPDKESDGGVILTHSDRSKVVRNNETANVLAWRLPKLRRLDHWEEGSGKIVVLVREGDKVRWEVRRTKV